MPNVEFVDRLSAVLEARGWTPYQWAQRAELSDATVANMITRQAKGARTQTLQALAKSAGVSFEWLASGQGASGLDADVPTAIAVVPTTAPQINDVGVSRLEHAVGEAFEHGRHVARAVTAVLEVITDTDQRQSSDADLLDAARTWLDAATDILRSGESVTAERLLTRVTYGKTQRAREVGAELPGPPPPLVWLRAAWVSERAIVVWLAGVRWAYAPGGRALPEGTLERELVGIVRRTGRRHRTLLGDEAFPVGPREARGVVILLRL